MKIIKSILLVALSSQITAASATTCRETNQGLKFRQVVMIPHADARCDYGKDFDFNHSYDLAGPFMPVSGPWSGSSDPNLIFCRLPGNAAGCVF